MIDDFPIDELVLKFNAFAAISGMKILKNFRGVSSRPPLGFAQPSYPPPLKKKKQKQKTKNILPSYGTDSDGNRVKIDEKQVNTNEFSHDTGLALHEMSNCTSSAHGA